MSITITTVYDFDAETGEYLGTRQVQRHPGVGLPAGSTDVPPPEAQAGNARVWNGKAWEQVEDNRGAAAYDTATAEAEAVRDLGPLPASLTLIAPDCPFPRWDEDAGAWTTDTESQASAARAERDARLTITDWLCLRHRDEQDSGVATTLSGEQYAELLAYRQALRDVTAQADFPGNINWPDAPAWIEE